MHSTESHTRKWKQYLFIIVVSFFTAVFLYTQMLAQTAAFSANGAPKAVFKGEKGIALTFNIGWGDEKAVPIIKTLQKNGVKSATFFLSGAWAEQHPDIVQMIEKAGYEIGSLGYAYVDYTDTEPSKVRSDMLKAQEVFKKLEVKDVKLIRSPTGHFDKTTLKIANQLGLTVVHWSINTNDWKNPGTDKIIEKASEAKNGDIVLLHASDAAKQTNKALPTIIRNLSHEGKFIAVSEMIANGETKTKVIP
ncbi:polysaccharide deacetylase family sporulation protein PdaB [Weizmannia acidilactici]|uniref:polysaccharide deacetylase family sporulation protein PdaB n=1 Tax=Weizmannia acidilactici TaxID=2607726 RepID=UPI00124EEBC8|nr:polysaccharide deacetylase family sporulation protein PdaB [Weizmannia acidilactici]GER67214.1 polysaccharide deacetylase family sporulation protein PdaB [Weizmannia acidilactici]